VTQNRDITQQLQLLRVGYVPYSDSLESPGDRRRFGYYARKRGIKFEIADPDKKYDLVVLCARADIGVWSQYPDAKLVYDLIDSYLAIPRSSIKGQLRGLFKFLSGQSRYLQLDYWKSVSNMCARADAVVCSTLEQQNDILRFCQNVHMILDAQMDVVRIGKTDYSAGSTFRIVWEGLPYTLGSLALMRPVLEKLRLKFPVEMHVVTDREYWRYMARYGKVNTVEEAERILPGVVFHEWNESDCADIICSCDLAVIPLALDDPFSAGKPENKLLLFWRMGMPAVTSASPAYLRAMHAAGMDFAIKDEVGWVSKIERLAGSQDARREAGELGKAYADREFSEASLLARWDAVFASVGFTFNDSRSI